MSDVRARLERMSPADRVRDAGERGGNERVAIEEFVSSGVRFTADRPEIEHAYYRAVNRLVSCVAAGPGGIPILQEGGVYRGTWLESTGSISAEVLSRFMPEIAGATFRAFADHARADGLLPYKLTPDGPSYRQIQMVTPLARSVWNHHRLSQAHVDADAATAAGAGAAEARSFLAAMYPAMARFDQWLADHRDTRGTGCVEAFCAFDTGHDLSPRFWHVPDTPFGDDPTAFDPDSPVLPFLAPDLTANVYCQRLYLAKIAEEIGAPEGGWPGKAASTVGNLFAHCYHEGDGFFYDVDRNGRLVKIQSDVLLRVLACEVGDAGFFESSLRRYLLNTRKFFAKYPLTSIALDDPRFDWSSSYNTWAGATNFLSVLRAPHAFELHGRYVELTWIMQPILSACSRMERFGQTVSPWTGREGYTESYSPAILCFLDFVERLSGIVPRPDGSVWCTGLLPSNVDHGLRLADETAYGRTIGGRRFRLSVRRDGCSLSVDDEVRIRFPYGVRVVTDREGALCEVLGMSGRSISGNLTCDAATFAMSVAGNERLVFTADGPGPASGPGVVLPTYE